MNLAHLPAILAVGVCVPIAAADGLFLAEGVKIGEVTPNSAIIWTRLARAERPDPQSWHLEGADGQVKIAWRAESPGVGAVDASPWAPVDPERGFTIQVALKDLRPATAYTFEVHYREKEGAVEHRSASGRFRTAPPDDAPARVRFVVTTGHKYATIDEPGQGQRIYPSMLAIEPDFFVHTGDVVYYDNDVTNATNVAEARTHWHRLYALPHQRRFHWQTPSYFMKDDHDTLKDDCWPGQTYHQLTFEQGQAIFREQVPIGGKPFRTFRWGRDLQIWLAECRDFRSPNSMPDGPDKTIWGREQIEWFQRTVRESDATFRVLISPGPLVGPDRSNKRDNHANPAFRHEGAVLREFIASQKNMIVICGDRHWQYVSIDPETGLREYSCGPSTDAHAGGWKESDRTPMHAFLRVRGGFLSGTVERPGGAPALSLRHYAVDGTVVHTDTIPAR